MEEVDRDLKKLGLEKQAPIRIRGVERTEAEASLLKTPQLAPQEPEAKKGTLRGTSANRSTNGWPCWRTI